MLQSPALGLAQAGIIRRENALSMLMQTITGFAIGSNIMEWLCGFSLTFGKSINGIIGNLDNMFFRGISSETCYENSTALTFSTR